MNSIDPGPDDVPFGFRWLCELLAMRNRSLRERAGYFLFHCLPADTGAFAFGSLLFLLFDLDPVRLLLPVIIGFAIFEALILFAATRRNHR